MFKRISLRRYLVKVFIYYKKAQHDFGGFFSLVSPIDGA